MIIHHYYPQRLNIGDSFVRDGIRKLISARVPDAEFVDLSVSKPRRPSGPFGLTGENVARSNAEADLVVIGGSNLYQCRKSGAWGVATDVESIRRLSPPVMLIGIGSGSSFMHTTRACSRKSAEEIQLLNHNAIGSSIRDVRTGQFLDALGVGGYTLTGCPATFVFDRPFAFNDGELVAIPFPPVRFRKRRFMFGRLMRALRKYIGYCEALGLRAVVPCHDHRDLEAARGLTGRGVEVFCSENTRDYYDLYAKCRLAVGFRLHGSIICLAMGIPFIPVYFDMRGIAFAETYDSLDRMVDGSRFGLLKALQARTRDILDGKREPFEKFLSGKRHLRGVMESFVSGCMNRL